VRQTNVYYVKAYENFSIEHVKRSGTFNMSANHYHNTYEIYYLLSGERFYFIKDRTYHIKKGDIVLINVNDLHKTTNAGSTAHERILINIGKEFLGDLNESIEDVELFSPFEQGAHVFKSGDIEQSFVESLLFRIIQESKNSFPGFKTCIKILLADLLIYLNRHIPKNPEEGFKHPSPLYEKISEIARYINCSYMEELNLKHISEKFFISPYYLSRVFKEVTGFTFVEYLNSVRTKEAVKLLKESRLSITRIAEKTGYDSATHFGRVFKGIMGVSPLKYRKIASGDGS